VLTAAPLSARTAPTAAANAAMTVGGILIAKDIYITEGVSELQWLPLRMLVPLAARKVP
jgi:hypothetical protein